MSDTSGSLGTATLAKQLAQELLANPATQAPGLRVIRGPQVAPCILPRPPSAVQIGRSELATWRLDDPSVSREQCVVERTETGTFVIDTSRRGTQVGGVEVTGRVGPLVSGQTISFGNVVIVFDELAMTPRAQETTQASAAVVPAQPWGARQVPVAAARTKAAVMPWWWWALMAAVLASLAWLLI